VRCLLSALVALLFTVVVSVLSTLPFADEYSRMPGSDSLDVI